MSMSDNDIPHRIIGNITYRKEFAKAFALQFTLAGQSQTQGRYSYLMNFDLNGDGIANNDLLYIPKSKDEMNFEQYTSGTTVFTVDAQKEAFEKYINNDDYLSKHRGEYAQRNGALYLMVPRFDFSTVLEIFSNIGKKRHTIQLRADIFNFGNMINPSWGVGYVVNNPSILNSGSKTFNPITNQPIYRLAPLNGSLDYTTYRRGASILDVWQAQFGVRYSF